MCQEKPGPGRVNFFKMSSPRDYHKRQGKVGPLEKTSSLKELTQDKGDRRILSRALFPTRPTIGEEIKDLG